MRLRAGDQIGVFARKPNSAPACAPNGLDNAFVDQTRQNHFHDLNGRVVCDALAIDKFGLDVELPQHIVDHRSAAVNDDGVHADLPHQHDVAGKTLHRRVASHRVATQFDDDGRAFIALKVRQSLVQGPRGCNPIPVHSRCLLSVGLALLPLSVSVEKSFQREWLD